MLKCRSAALFFLAAALGSHGAVPPQAQPFLSSAARRDSQGTSGPPRQSEPTRRAADSDEGLMVKLQGAMLRKTWSRPMGLVTKSVLGKLVPFVVLLGASAAGEAAAAAASSTPTASATLDVIISSYAHPGVAGTCTCFPEEKRDVQHEELFRMLGKKGTVLLSACPRAPYRTVAERQEALLRGVGEAWERQAVGAMQDFFAANPQLMLRPLEERRIAVRILLEDHKGYISEGVLGNRLGAETFPPRGESGLERVLEPTIRAVLEQFAGALGLMNAVEQDGEDLEERLAALKSVFESVHLKILTCRSGHGISAQWYPQVDPYLEEHGYGVLDSVGLFELPLDDHSVQWQSTEVAVPMEVDEGVEAPPKNKSVRKYQLTAGRLTREKNCRAEELEKEVLAFLELSEEDVNLLARGEVGSLPPCEDSWDQRWVHWLAMATVGQCLGRAFLWPSPYFSVATLSWACLCLRRCGLGRLRQRPSGCLREEDRKRKATTRRAALSVAIDGRVWTKTTWNAYGGERGPGLYEVARGQRDYYCGTPEDKKLFDPDKDSFEVSSEWTDARGSCFREVEGMTFCQEKGICRSWYCCGEGGLLEQARPRPGEATTNCKRLEDDRLEGEAERALEGLRDIVEIGGKTED